MAVVYPNSVKASRMQAVVDDIGTAGVLEIGTTGMATVLATFNLANPAGTVSSDVLTLATFPQTIQATATGTAAAARIRTGASADIVTGLTVGTSGTDVVVDNTSIATGQDVTLSSATITHAA